MVTLLKKRITADFFHVALFLTLLHGEFLYNPSIIRNIDNYLEANNTDNNGWTLSAPSYHNYNNDLRNYFDPPIDTLTRKGFDDFQPLDYLPSRINTNTGSFYEDVQDEFDYQQIVDELRRLTTIRRPNLDVVIGKGTPSFQNITAYLVSNTTNSGLNGLASTVPDLPTLSSSGGQGYFQPLSVISDDGHVVILSANGQAQLEAYEVSSIEVELENVEQVTDTLFNTDGNELEDHMTVNNNETDAAVESTVDPAFELETQPEFLDSTFSFFDSAENEEKPVEENSIQHDLDLNVLGASALWPPSSSLFVDNEIVQEEPTSMEATSLDSDYELALGLDEQARALEFLETLHAYDDEELMSVISPLAIHRHSDDEGEEGSFCSPDEEDEELGSVSRGTERRRTISTCSSVSSRRSSFKSTNSPSTTASTTHWSSSSPSSSHDERATNDKDDDNEMAEINANTTIASAVNSLIEELWETDSGIFDTILEETESQSQTSPSPFNLDGLPEAISDLDFGDSLSVGNESPGNTHFDSTETETGESTAVDEMIQTAPFHTNVRPTSHPAQPRGYQVHSRMPALLRATSMDQRWQELANVLSLHDPNGGPLPHPLPHHFGAHHHHHHHLHHHPSTLHHHHAAHAMHHAAFSGAPPPTTPYNTDTTRNVLLQNATLPPPELNSTGPYGNVTMGLPPNLGSAVASSMHLTNSSDPMSDPSSHYKMIESNDMLSYYPNTTNTEMSNQTADGFLSSILNDEDLQLMDMAMNEGMYTMRLMDNSTNPHHGAQTLSHEANISVGTGINSTGPGTASEDRMEASSDSAVSSMGSERVPPTTDPHNISDNEWSETEHHSHSSPYGDYHGNKIRGFDYYNKDRNGPPVAQKKHQMFGKRFQQEHGPIIPHPYSLNSHPSSDLPLPYPSTSGLHVSGSSLEPPEMKYSCSIDFTRHQNDVRIGGTPGSGVVIQSNHTYSLPPSHSDNLLLSSRISRGPPKEKQSKMMKDFKSEEHLSRDEKRARTMGLPMITDDIINLPMDEFNERLSKYDLTETQLSLIRDIRRRGKNKVAAQNCRKRKLDQILQLADEVQRIRDKKSSLLREENNLSARRNNLRDKYAALYRHVFQALRDPEGNTYSTHEYTLQQAADGNIVLVPRNSTIPSTSYGTNDTLNSHPSSRRGRSKDDMKKDGPS